MTRGLIEHVRRWINTFPTNAGITGNYSPSNIIDETQNTDCNWKRIVYGAYAQVYNGTTNNMQSRTTPAVALHESNGFDGQYFMSIDTCCRIHSKKWTQLPVDDTVISKNYQYWYKGKATVSSRQRFPIRMGSKIKDRPTSTSKPAIRSNYRWLG